MEGDGGNESSPAQLMGTAESLRILVRRDLTDEMDSRHVIIGCQDLASCIPHTSTAPFWNLMDAWYPPQHFIETSFTVRPFHVLTGECGARYMDLLAKLIY